MQLKWTSYSDRGGADQFNSWLDLRTLCGFWGKMVICSKRPTCRHRAKVHWRNAYMHAYIHAYIHRSISILTSINNIYIYIVSPHPPLTPISVLPITWELAHAERVQRIFGAFILVPASLCGVIGVCVWGHFMCGFSWKRPAFHGCFYLVRVGRSFDVEVQAAKHYNNNWEFWLGWCFCYCFTFRCLTAGLVIFVCQCSKVVL